MSLAVLIVTHARAADILLSAIEKGDPALGASAAVGAVRIGAVFGPAQGVNLIGHDLEEGGAHAMAKEVVEKEGGFVAGALHEGRFQG